MSLLPRHEYELLGDIYDAALDASHWAGIMRRITEACEAHSAIIVATDLLNADYNLIMPHNLSAECLAEYRDRRLDIIDMEVNGKALLRLGLGVAGDIRDMHGSWENWQEQGGVFYDFMEKLNSPVMGGLALDSGDFRWSALGVHRSREAGFFPQETIAFLNRLSPHIRRSLQIHRQLSLTRRPSAALYALLDKMRAGVLLLDARGLVVHANAAAETLLRTSRLLRVSGSNLACTEASAQRELQGLIQGAIATSQRDCQGQAGGVMGIAGNAGADSSLMLSVLPLSALEAYQELRSDNVAAAIFITSPSQGLALSEKLLQDNFDLSPREIEICQHFIARPTLEAMAVELGVSLSTLRTYMKTIYAKTGQHSQAELMRLLMGLTLDFQHIR